VSELFNVKPQGLVGAWADVLMVPFMYLASGTFRESPQRTHFWNNRKLTQGEIRQLLPRKMVKVEGIKGEYDPADVLFPFLHIPILFGWRNYIALQPQVNPKAWFIGWVTGGTGGISRIPLKGRVRMLIGPGDVEFFAIENGRQITLLKGGRGKIGQGGPYGKLPLL